MGYEIAPSLLGRRKQKQRGLRGYYVDGPPLFVVSARTLRILVACKRLLTSADYTLLRRLNIRN